VEDEVMKKLWARALLAMMFVFAVQPCLQAQQAGSVDFHGIWKDPYDVTCWVYKFIVIENELVIRTLCPQVGEEEIFGWATLNGRSFSGKMNAEPHGGRSRYAGPIEGRISDDNQIIYMTWPQRTGPHQSKFIRNE
jgi:hypothetical protein